MSYQTPESILAEAARLTIADLDDIIYRASAYCFIDNPTRQERDRYWVRKAQYLELLRRLYEYQETAARFGWCSLVFQPQGLCHLAPQRHFRMEAYR